MLRSQQKREGTALENAPAGIVPAGTPEWITPHLISETIRVWQPYYREVLTPEDAVTMIRNVGRLYLALSSEP
jgi:hypothetical protein